MLALLVLRLRAWGRLDLTDEEFGRFYLFGTRLYIPCGCILRRYVLAFGHDLSTRHNRSADSRSMSRSERRAAIEHILFRPGAQVIQKNNKNRTSKDDDNGSQGSLTSDSSPDPEKIIQSDHSHSQSSEEALCSICLTEYGKRRLSAPPFTNPDAYHYFHSIR